MEKSRETEGRWKEPMFIPSSVQQREIAKFTWINEDSSYITLLTVWFLLSSLYDIINGMQLLSKLTMLSLHAWLVFSTCSDRRHIEPDAPAPANYNHRGKCLWREQQQSKQAANAIAGSFCLSVNKLQVFRAFVQFCWAERKQKFDPWSWFGFIAAAALYELCV